MKVEIGQYKKFSTGSLKAMFTLFIPEWGNMQIDKCKYFESTLGNKWFNFPDEKGKTDESGKTSYFKLIRIHDKLAEKKLQAEVLNAIKELNLEENNGQAEETNQSNCTSSQKNLLPDSSCDLW